MNKRLILPFIILVTCLQLCAHTLTRLTSITHLIQHFKQTAGMHATKHWVFAFDIDDTIAMPKGKDGKASLFGGDRWFCHIIEKHKHAGMSHEAAHQQAIHDYLHVQHHIHLTTPEAETVRVITELQKEPNFTVLALTARSPHIADRTHEQLCALGINFAHGNPPQEIVLLPQDHPELVGPVLYRDGKIHCGNNNKGVALNKILHHLAVHPHGIVMIDDKEHHAKSVVEHAHKHNRMGIGFHYIHLADFIKNFNADEVDAAHTELLKAHPPIVQQ